MDAERIDIRAVASSAASQIEQRLPPHDLECEQAILGGVMLEADAIARIEAIITDGDFYHPANAVIFRACSALKARMEPIDITTLAAELRAGQVLNTIGGVQYLGELSGLAPSSAHIESHARILAQLAQARRAIAESYRLIALAYERPRDHIAIAECAAQVCLAIEPKTLREPQQLSIAITEAFEDIERAAARGDSLQGLETGFTDLDQLTGGYQDDESTIVAARTSVGKTVFGLQSALHVAEKHMRPVLFYSIEMRRVKLAIRAMSGRGKVDSLRVRTGKFAPDDMANYTRAAQEMWHVPLYLDDDEALSVSRMRASIRKFARQHKDLCAVFIDYLQLIAPEKEYREAREREVSAISRAIKRLSRELRIPFITMAQVSRRSDQRSKQEMRPQLSDLRESGSIEQDADNVFFLYRDELVNRNSEDKGIAEIIVAKQRNGPCDTVRLRFLERWTMFANLMGEDKQPAAPAARGPSRRSEKSAIAALPAPEEDEHYDGSI